MDPEKVRQVLERVLTAPDNNEVKPGESQRLRQLMEERQQAINEVETVTAQCRSQRTRQDLCELKKELYHQKAELVREYFLLTGDTYYPAGGRVEHRDMVTMLREIYILAENAALIYTGAGRETESGYLCRLYGAIAQSSQNWAGKMRCAVSRAMGIDRVM